MDALAGYGSDSSSESSASATPKEHEEEPKNVEKKKPSGASQASKGIGVTKRAKKLLSLNAVLPTEIFERLTKASNNLDYEDGESSSDDDERSDIINKNNKKNDVLMTKSKSTMKTEKKGGAKRGGTPTALSSLLQDLKSCASSKNNKSNSGKLTLTKRDLSFTHSNSTAGEPASSVGSSKTDNSSSVVKEKTPQKQTTSADLNKSTTINTNPYSSLRPPAATRIQGVPLPSASRSFYSYQSNVASYPVPPSNNNTISSAQQNQHQQIQPMVWDKKTKRKMEKALRSGQIDQFDAPNAITMNQEVPIHHLSASQHAQFTQASSLGHIQRAGQGGEVYNVKEGKMVPLAEITQKHKSKHQIHQLVQNARILQANRAFSGQNSNTGSRKVNAKRKYGW